MTLRLIWRQTVMNVMMTLEYRGAFFIYMFNTIAGPVVSLMVWLTVSEQGVRLPYNRSQFVTYYTLLSVVSMLTATWLGGYLAESIRLGKISPLLLRPAPILPAWIGNNLGEKVIKLPLLLPLVALVALFFRQDLRLPTDPLAWLLFAISLPLAAALAFLIDFVLGSLAFWVEDVNALIRVKVLIGAFLAGQYVPLALFPPGLLPLLRAQPFRYTLSFPLEVLTGALSRRDLLLGFGCAIAYCAGLWACYRLLWRYGLRRYAASGG